MSNMHSNEWTAVTALPKAKSAIKTSILIKNVIIIIIIITLWFHIMCFN